MRRFTALSTLAAAAVLAACATGGSSDNPMGFFVTSSNMGKGADLGGLEGADKHCQALAASVGAGSGTWRAYLSTSGATPVNARDRIGSGPWVNANGLTVASNVEELHGSNRLAKVTALTEKGEEVKGRGDTPNQHDVLTGSAPDGKAIAGDKDTTCGNWTKSGEGSAIVGHSDRTGLDESAPAKSWNSSHATSGCSTPQLNATGGNGYFYCFKAK
ncbi:MAG: hypothetical protein ABIR94_16645 [Rubrivivax sp.]